MNKTSLFIVGIMTVVASPIFAQFKAEELRSLPDWLSERNADTVRFGGTMDSHSPLSPEAYRAVSTSSIQMVTMTPGQTTASIPILLEDNSRTYLAVWPLHAQQRGTDFTISLDTKGQRGMTVQDQGTIETPFDVNLPANGKALWIDQSVAGEFNIQLTATAVASAQAYAVVMNSKNSLALSCSITPETIFTGMPILIRAQLQKDREAVLHATVHAEIVKEGKTKISRYTMTDDGRDGDQVAHDGIYTLRKVVGAELANTPGSWTLHVRATGKLASGNGFQRDTQLYFRHNLLAATLDKPSRECYVRNSDNKITHLILQVPVRILEPGKYRLFGTLAGKNATGELVPISWALETRSFTQSCEQVYNLVFAAAPLQASNISGPYALKLEVLSLDRMEAAAASLDGYWTAAYPAQELSGGDTADSPELQKMLEYKKKIAAEFEAK